MSTLRSIVDKKTNVPRGVDERQGERDALWRRVRPDDRDDITLGFIERRRPGKKRRRVAVPAEAEQQQIVDVTRFAEMRGEPVKFLFIFERGGFRFDRS